jgi:hypothetical protein
LTKMSEEFGDEVRMSSPMSEEYENILDLDRDIVTTILTTF